jgi:hypothetical protein
VILTPEVHKVLNSIAGSGGAQYGTLVGSVTDTAGSPTATVTSGGFPNVYEGEGVLDITPSSGVIPIPDYVSAPPSGNTLTMSGYASSSTVSGGTNDELSFGQDWAC